MEAIQRSLHIKFDFHYVALESAVAIELGYLLIPPSFSAMKCK